MLPRPATGRGDLLIDRYTVVYLPAAAALLRQPSGADAARSLLAVAPSRGGLRHTPEEARAIGALFQPNARTLIGGEATEGRFKQLAGDYRVLHLATHGYFNKASPLLSGLELEPSRNDDGMLRVHEILDLPLHADLVTLSACDTALGSGYFAEIPIGDEFVGLNRAFLAAGSASVMATLWQVDDRASVSLMKQFYGHLSESGNDRNAANALALAQRALRRSPQLGHPYYWAAYVVVGQINSKVEVARTILGENVMNAWKRITLTCFSLLVLGLAPIGAAFAQVKVTAATPASAYQGTISLDVVVSGSGFDPSAKVQYFVTGTTNPGGITVTKVVFRKSTEMVTTIDVADAADLANFDIQVTLEQRPQGQGHDVVLGQGEADRSAAAAADVPAGQRTGTPSRATAGRRQRPAGSTCSAVRPGTGAPDLDDLWSYANAGSSGATWTLHSRRHLDAEPAAQPRLVLRRRPVRDGERNRGLGFVKETWIFSESTQTWSQVNCRRVLCPSYRMGPTMAYDPAAWSPRPVRRGRR